ncbi:MAG: hypothetical protein ABIN25_10110 [Ginsengibacter sp.]
MKKVYILIFFFSIILVGGCSKDFLKRYDRRIIGTWRITDVNRVGLGGDAGDLPFRDGTFTFYENGSLDYINSANILFKGTWDLRKKRGYNSNNDNASQVHTLQITAVDFGTQQVLGEYYDDMNFVGTDHFKARINSNFHTYVTHFRR